MKKIVKFIKENPIEFIMTIILLYVFIQALIIAVCKISLLTASDNKEKEYLNYNKKLTTKTK